MCVNVNAFSLNTWQCILCNVLGVSYSSAIANGCTQCQHHLSLGNCKRANCTFFLLFRFARSKEGVRQQQHKNVVTIKLFSNSVLCVRWSEDPIFYLYNTILQVGARDTFITFYTTFGDFTTSSICAKNYLMTLRCYVQSAAATVVRKSLPDDKKWGSCPSQILTFNSRAANDTSVFTSQGRPLYTKWASK